MSSQAPSQQTRSSDRVADAGTRRANALAHLLLNGVLVVLFGALFIKAGALPASMWEPLGAGSFPRLVLAVLVVINLGIMAQEWRHFRGASSAEPGLVRRWLWRHRLAFGVLALFALYIVGVPALGFRLASLLFLTLAQLALGVRRPRSLAIAAVIAVTFSFGLDWLFRDVFIISLPRGPFG
ncbi:tripartite tricarboxylate transporter TctB family protein [Chromohalobacter marismortui]|uniref:Tripartite tricarboxylate transporter TctB family protein n=1 Tax=Chromohalobacter marismortui TaxID=42055 RepID=A0A4V3F442_9GAMM|nr:MULTISPECIES: tripartite tricarboxylate transporter TctB family protein [Chromohalobacter]MCI0509291.1 tripartite tricarboxylate transporter TctB family protein [Chromohalobacter sp.]MCI0593839.1 tripartite tricarboxylate transporter TctB family protein [Chromohalobacter sp.]TDU23816.1 tripartite tricarboxylate transporter TctB family protein [Chromohalobacter marismortui]